MILYSSNEIGILKSWTNIQSLIILYLSFWQTSEQFYTKLKYREKVFEEFQALPHFSRKLILYLTTKFSMLKLWTNSQSLRRFDSVFRQTSKQICRKLQYREKVFWRIWRDASLSQQNDFVFVDQILHSKALDQYTITEKIWFRVLEDFKTNLLKTQISGESFWRVSSFASFFQKTDFVLFDQNWHSKALTNSPWLRRFDLVFWQTWKQIYRKFQNREIFFEKFQGLPRSPRRMVLRHYPWKVVIYLLRKFCIFKHCTIIQLFGRLDIRLWKILKQIYRKLQYEENFSWFCLFCVCWPNYTVLSLAPI